MTAEPEDEMDFLFARLSPDKLARAMIGDVRIVPTHEQLAYAQSVIDRTGALYRMVAGFQLNEWQKRVNASDIDPTAGGDWAGDPNFK